MSAVLPAVIVVLFGNAATGATTVDIAPLEDGYDGAGGRSPTPRSRGPPSHPGANPADGCSDPSRPFDPQILSSAAVPRHAVGRAAPEVLDPDHDDQLQQPTNPNIRGGRCRVRSPRILLIAERENP